MSSARGLKSLAALASVKVETTSEASCGHGKANSEDRVVAKPQAKGKGDVKVDEAEEGEFPFVQSAGSYAQGSLF